MSELQPGQHELSEGLRGEIIGMRKVNTSFAEIGRILLVNEPTARKIWNRYQETGTYKSASQLNRFGHLSTYSICPT